MPPSLNLIVNRPKPMTHRLHRGAEAGRSGPNAWKKEV